MRPSDRASARVPAFGARTVALGLAAALALPGAASAMEFRVTGGQFGRYTIHATGPVAVGDAERFRAALAGAGNRRPLLSISSGGGVAREGLQIAQMVAQARVPVAVGNVCASACFLVFAASPDRAAGPSSRIGVHRAYHREMGETAGSLDATLHLARHASAWGVPTTVVGRMMTTPGQGISWLTPDDLRAMNVRSAQPGAERAEAPAEAAAPAPAPAPAAAAAMVELGRQDRLVYRRWLAGLSEQGREGAVFWMKQRRLARPGSCLNGNPAFSMACFEAQRLLAQVDGRSRDPHYLRGWEGL